MAYLAITKRILIVMFTGMLMFSGLTLVNDLIVENVSGNLLVFGDTWNSVATTGGGGVFISVNITTDGVSGAPNNAEVFFNFTINGPSGLIRGGQNISVTTRNDTSWTVVIKGPMPTNANQIGYDFSAWNMSDQASGVVRLSSQTINIIDNIKPTVVNLQNVEIGTGEEVKFNATGCTDNVDTPDNLLYHWNFNYGGVRNLSGKLQTFTFDNPGVYTVTLSIKDMSNNWNSGSMTVTVLADAISINATTLANLTFKNVVLVEDGTPFNTTLYNKIFINETVGLLSYKTGDTSEVNWTNVSWGSEYSTENLNVKIDNMGTPADGTDDLLIITPNPNKFSAIKENVTVKASLSGFEALFNFTATITSVNDAPEFVTYKLNNDTEGTPEGENISFSQVNEDGTVNITITADDADLPYGDGLSFGVFYQENTSTATILKLDNTTANLTFTPKKNFVGTSLVIITVTDDEGNVTKQNLTFILKPVNDAPSMISFVLNGVEGTVEGDGNVSFTIKEDETWNITITGADADLPYGEVLTYTVVSKQKDSVAVFGPVVGSMANLTFTPKANYNKNEIGNEAVLNISLEDKAGAVSFQIITFTVTPENDAPSIAGLGIKGNCSVPTAVENEPVSLTVRYLNNTLINGTDVLDIDKDVLTYTWYIKLKPTDPNASEEPVWTLAGNATGVNTTYTFTTTGTYLVWLKVSDASGGYDYQKVMTIAVNPYVPPAKPDDGDASSMPLIMIIVIVVLLIGGIVVALIMISKKKTETKAGDEFSEFDMPSESQPGMDQFGQPQQPQPGMDQFGQPMQPQPGMDQFGQPMQPQPGLDQFGQPMQPQPGMDQFGQPQQPPQAQPGLDQFGQPQQPQPGFDQFGQPQQPQQAQPGFDQFGQPQPGMGQFGQPQQPQQPAMGQYGGAPMQQSQQSLPQAGAPMGGGNLCPHCRAPIEPGWFLCPNCKNQI